MKTCLYYDSKISLCSSILKRKERSLSEVEMLAAYTAKAVLREQRESKLAPKFSK